MNRLLMKLAGDMRLRDPEPGTDGAPPASTPAPAPTGEEKPADPAPATPATDPAPAPTGDEAPADPLDGVTLGENKPAEPNAQPATPAPEINEEDYGKVAIDTDIAADVEVDQGAMKAVAPILKEAGVTPETAGKLVNALARYQVEQFKARNAERFADNKRMHDAAVQKYSKMDFAQINAGIDAAFKPGGIMNYVIRHSELGNDPEFLELMKWYGAHHPTNTQPSDSGTGSGTTGQPAGFAGIAESWK